MNTTVEAKISLKEIQGKLRESSGILESIEGKLGYLATNQPQDMPKSESQQGDGATLDSLNMLTNNIGRRVSNIAGFANTIIGN